MNISLGEIQVKATANLSKTSKKLDELQTQLNKLIGTGSKIGLTPGIGDGAIIASAALAAERAVFVLRYIPKLNHKHQVFSEQSIQRVRQMSITLAQLRQSAENALKASSTEKIVIDPATVAELHASIDKLSANIDKLADKTPAPKVEVYVNDTLPASAELEPTVTAESREPSKLGILLASVKRIVMYRLIRSAIKVVSTGFSDGVKSAYEWATENNHGFKEVMDRYATEMLYIKNSLGALAANILSLNTGFFEKVGDALVAAINVFNEFIASLKGLFTGDYSYLVAKKVAVTFGDNAEEAAKELKALYDKLAPFDELNVIRTQKDYGTGVELKDGDFEKATANKWLPFWLLLGAAVLQAITYNIPTMLGPMALQAVPVFVDELYEQFARNILIQILVVRFDLRLEWKTKFKFDPQAQAQLGKAFATATATAMGWTGQGLNWKWGQNGGLIIDFPIVQPVPEGEGQDIPPVPEPAPAPKPSYADVLAKVPSVNWGDIFLATIFSAGLSFLIPGFVPAYASGGFPEIGSVFLAGEDGMELVGTINGRTGVASEDEITGISDAFYSRGETTNGLLRELIAVRRRRSGHAA